MKKYEENAKAIAPTMQSQGSTLRTINKKKNPRKYRKTKPAGLRNPILKKSSKNLTKFVLYFTDI
jgi:hypothetical protein